MKYLISHPSCTCKVNQKKKKQQILRPFTVESRRDLDRHYTYAGHPMLPKLSHDIRNNLFEVKEVNAWLLVCAGYAGFVAREEKWRHA